MHQRQSRSVRSSLSQRTHTIDRLSNLSLILHGAQTGSCTGCHKIFLWFWCILRAYHLLEACLLILWRCIAPGRWWGKRWKWASARRHFPCCWWERSPSIRPLKVKVSQVIFCWCEISGPENRKWGFRRGDSLEVCSLQQVSHRP